MKPMNLYRIVIGAVMIISALFTLRITEGETITAPCCSVPGWFS